FALVRYNSDGSLDTSFNHYGKLTTVIGSQANALCVAIKPDERILAAGVSINEVGQYFFVLVMYNPDGTIDSSFGTDGIATTVVESGAGFSSIAQQPDGKFVAAG